MSEDEKPLANWEQDVLDTKLCGDKIITKEEMEADTSKRFLYTLQQFFKAALMKTKDNDIMIRAYFFAIIGAYMKEYTITKVGGSVDLRVPIIFVQNSGSGKSQLNKVGLDMSHKLGLRAAELTQFTTTGLIGTFDKSKHENNIKNGLKHVGDFIEKQDKKGNLVRKEYQIPIVYGDLYYHDILFIDEGKILFIADKHTENVLSVLQPILDYPGRVRKKLAAEDAIEYDCSCTLVTSTVEFANMNRELMLQGFFPRCLFYSRRLSIFDYANMHRLLNQTFFDEAIYKESLNNIIDAMTKNHPIDRNRKRIKVLDACLERIGSEVQRWFRVIKEKMYGAELDVAQAFVSRMNGFIFKIAGQISVLNHHTEINAITGEETYIVGGYEIDYAIDVITPLFDNLVKTITIYDKNGPEAGMYAFIIKVMTDLSERKTEVLSKTAMITRIMKSKNLGRQRSEKYYNDLIRANFITEEPGKGRETTTRPNWTLWLEKTTVKKHFKEEQK